MAPTTFPLFARLPIEIRHLIWREYLLSHCQSDKPTLYLYSKNFFLQHLDPDFEDDRYNCISRTPLVEMDAPLLMHVNSDARNATLQWARASGMLQPGTRSETTTATSTTKTNTTKTNTTKTNTTKTNTTKNTSRKGKGSYVFTRDFDPARDILYVSRDKWDEFCELYFDGDGLEETAAQIQHLALPAFTAYYSFVELGNLMEWFTSLKTVSSVWGSLPELEYADKWHFLRSDSLLRQLYLLPETTSDDDSTDTGGDLVAGEMDDRIAVGVQPRWVLEDETAEIVKMCVRDPLNGSETWEAGERELWMSELEEAMLTVELPEHVYDVEEEKFLVEFRAVRARRVR
ncbi:hypothetical protein E4U21_002987 [Claviceps maximensis]|nr:hypothetical protein E4U21_002987 [Claviceps maximensis]